MDNKLPKTIGDLAVDFCIAGAFLLALPIIIAFSPLIILMMICKKAWNAC
jgi:hypothetical protein